MQNDTRRWIFVPRDLKDIVDVSPVYHVDGVLRMVKTFDYLSILAF